jgi:hypothetical protein
VPRPDAAAIAAVSRHGALNVVLAMTRSPASSHDEWLSEPEVLGRSVWPLSNSESGGCAGQCTGVSTCMHRRLNTARVSGDAQVRPCCGCHERLPAPDSRNPVGRMAASVRVRRCFSVLSGAFSHTFRHVHAQARRTTMRSAAFPEDRVMPPMHAAGVYRSAATRGAVVNLGQRGGRRSWCVKGARHG